jgi:hypothetical protein
MVKAANKYNDPPEKGMKSILVKVWVRNIGTTDSAGDMDSSSFKSTGSNNTLYEMPSVVDPEPALDVFLFSGGVYEGWITFLAAEGETNLMAVFTPWTDREDGCKEIYMTLVSNICVHFVTMLTYRIW